MPIEPRIRVQGLREFKRDLRNMDRGLARELNRSLRSAVSPIAREASALAPRKSGQLAGSLRPFTSGAAVGVRSRVVYAGVQHWGGRVGRGKATVIERRPVRLANGTTIMAHDPFIWQAAASREDELIDRLGDAVEDLWRG